MIPTDPSRLGAAQTDATHIDDADLHLLALAERDTSKRERAHLAECADCAGEYRALSRIVQLGRSVGSVRLLTPSVQVWSKIHSELGLSDVVLTPCLVPPTLSGAAATGQATAARPGGEAQRSVVSIHETAELKAAREVPVAGNFDLVRRPTRRWWVPLAAAAAVIGLVGGVAIGIASANSGVPREQVVARATLEALPGYTTGGSARLEKAEDGSRSVVVDLDALATSAAPGGDLLEVWLLRTDASGLVSIGFLDGTTGRFTIPGSIDLSQYPLVDVSAEPADGDPAHSGDSIVRGPLRPI